MQIQLRNKIVVFSVSLLVSFIYMVCTKKKGTDAYLFSSFIQESVSCVTPLKKDSFVYGSAAEDSACGTSQESFPGEFRRKRVCITGSIIA